MEKKEMVSIARSAIDKHMDYETLMYSDYLYGRESLVDDVWEYVEECQRIGSVAFDEKYKETK